MRQHLFAILLSAFCIPALLAQTDRKNPPPPGPAPEIRLSQPETFTLENGLRVFVVEDHKLPQVAFYLYLDRDPIIEGEYAGMLTAVGELLRSGTRTRSKQDIDEAIDYLGATLETGSKGVYASCLQQHVPALLEIFSDLILETDFQQAELDRIRNQALSRLALAEEQPDALAARLGDVMRFGINHPYGEFATEASWRRLTLRQCKRFYETFWRPNIGYLAVVGDIKSQEAQALVRRYFSAWERGDIPSYRYDTPAPPEQREVALLDRPTSVQSTLQVTYPIPLKRGDKDEFAAVVANAILGQGSTGRLYQNLRETHGFTYGAYSEIDRDEWAGSFTVYTEVRNSVTDSALTEILREMKRIRDQQVTDEELRTAKNMLIGAFARSLEDPQTFASLAILTERLKLPKDYFPNYLKNLEAVTASQVQAAAQKYILPDRAHIVVVGKGAEISDDLKFLGNLTYYDSYAQPYQPEGQGLRQGLTAEMVLQKYLQAVGGADKLAGINDLTFRYGADLYGRGVSINEIHLAPNIYSWSLEGELFVSKLIFNGEAAVKKSTTGGVEQLSGTALEQVRYDALLFPELYYQQYGYQTELQQVEEVNGKPAFVVQVTDPLGRISHHYFDTRNGLKVRMVSQVQGPDGSPLTQTLDFDDFRQVEGLRIPHKIFQKLGEDVIEIRLAEVKMNQGLKKRDFLVE